MMARSVIAHNRPDIRLHPILIKATIVYFLADIGRSPYTLRGWIMARPSKYSPEGRERFVRLERFPLRRSNTVSAVSGVVHAFAGREQAERDGHQLADLLKVSGTGGA